MERMRTRSSSCLAITRGGGGGEAGLLPDGSDATTTRVGGYSGQGLDRKEAIQKNKRGGYHVRKSAAPGLPAWSPTAVLPRLEPA